MEKFLQFNLQYYRQVLSRRTWFFFLPFFFVLCGATVASFILPEVYRSSTTILIERDQVINPLTKGLGVASEMEERLRTLRQGILSRPLIEKVIKKLGLDLSVQNPVEFEDLIKEIQKNLTVTVKGNDLFSVSYEGQNPVQVRDLVSTLTGLYIEENLNAKRSEAYAAFDFINEQLQIYKKKLEDSEKTLREFKEANLKDLRYKIPTVLKDGGTGEVQAGSPVGELLGAGAQNSHMAKLEQYQNALTEVEIALKEANLKMSLLKNQLEKEPPTTNNKTILANPVETKLKELESQLAGLRTQYTDQHPDVIQTKNEIEMLKKQLASSKPIVIKNPEGSSMVNPVYENLRKELTAVEIQIKSLEKRRDQLQSKIEEAELKVKSIPKLEQEFIRLTRDYNVNENIYQMLLRRLEEARISRELEVKDKGTTFTVIEPPVLPLRPVKPNKLWILLMGFLGGIGVGLGTVFLVEYKYQPFDDQKEIELYLGMPVLVEIPNIRTEEDIKRRKRSTRLIASLCGLYLLITGGILTWQALKENPSYFQVLVNKFQDIYTTTRR
ncbi:MAG TPA: GNVR domain-containing protein [Candidatus Limnocylindrales bacterium]|nr:GNVR domain-containing protein [Candidatus Limnocylindrales bacterium]